MQDLKSVLEQFVYLADERYERLAARKKPNFKHYNENISINDKMIPIQIGIETEISNLDNESLIYIERIEKLGRAVGLSIAYTKTEIGLEGK